MELHPLMSPLVLAAVLALAACAASHDVGGRAYQPSGFLGDYSKLEPGRGNEALARFIDPNADFAGYARVQVDPVAVWQREGTGEGVLSEAEARRLATRLESTLREELTRDFEVVEVPGPDTLRIRAAITEARGAPVALVAGAASGTMAPPGAPTPESFVGVAAIEVEVLDAASGRRLAAAVDQRAFRREADPATHTWSGLDATVERWAARIATRLAILRNVDAAERARDAAAD